MSAKLLAVHTERVLRNIGKKIVRIIEVGIITFTGISLWADDQYSMAANLWPMPIRGNTIYPCISCSTTPITDKI